MIQYEYITNSNFADNQCIIFELKFSRVNVEVRFLEKNYK